MMALSPRIASIFARWARLEKQLNQLFTLVTDADPASRSQFDSLRGWDRRAGAIVREAYDRLDPSLADLVKVVLRLVKEPAAKRDELAHRVWAIAVGFEAELVLLPPDDQHIFAEAAVEVKNAGRSDIPLHTRDLYAGSSLVSARDLDLLIRELNDAWERMDSLLKGHFFGSFSDATGEHFQGFRKKLADDCEITKRLANVARDRRRAEKMARREEIQIDQAGEK